MQTILISLDEQSRRDTLLPLPIRSWTTFAGKSPGKTAGQSSLSSSATSNVKMTLDVKSYKSRTKTLEEVDIGAVNTVFKQYRWKSRSSFFFSMHIPDPFSLTMVGGSSYLLSVTLDLSMLPCIFAVDLICALSRRVMR